MLRSCLAWGQSHVHGFQGEKQTAEPCVCVWPASRPRQGLADSSCEEPNITDLMIIARVTLLWRRISCRLSVSLSVSWAPAASSVHSLLITPRHSCKRAGHQSFYRWVCKALNCSWYVGNLFVDKHRSTKTKHRAVKRFLDGDAKQVPWFVAHLLDGNNLPWSANKSRNCCTGWAHLKTVSLDEGRGETFIG